MLYRSGPSIKVRRTSSGERPGPPQLLTAAIGRKTVDDRVSREGGVRGLPRFLNTRAPDIARCQTPYRCTFKMPHELNYALK